MRTLLLLSILLSLSTGPAVAGNRADVNADRTVNATDSVCLANILAGNLDAGEFNLENVVVVAPQGGDFTDPADAADWVADQSPGAANRFVILVTPGQYALTRPLSLPSYTTLRGYGPANTILYRTGGEAVPPFGAVVVLSETWNGALEDLQLINLTGGAALTAVIYNSGCYFCQIRSCSIRLEQSVSFGAGFLSIGEVDLAIYDTQILATQQWAPAEMSTSTAGIYMEADASDLYGIISLTNSRINASCNTGAPGFTRTAIGVHLAVDSTSKQISGEFCRISAGSGTGDDWYFYRTNSGFGSFTLCFLGGGTNSIANLNLYGCVP